MRNGGNNNIIINEYSLDTQNNTDRFQKVKQKVQLENQILNLHNLRGRKLHFSDRKHCGNQRSKVVF
jgi:hypothetical protein